MDKMTDHSGVGIAIVKSLHVAYGNQGTDLIRNTEGIPQVDSRTLALGFSVITRLQLGVMLEFVPLTVHECRRTITILSVLLFMITSVKLKMD